MFLFVKSSCTTSKLTSFGFVSLPNKRSIMRVAPTTMYAPLFAGVILFGTRTRLLESYFLFFLNDFSSVSGEVFSRYGSSHSNDTYDESSERREEHGVVYHPRTSADVQEPHDDECARAETEEREKRQEAKCFHEFFRGVLHWNRYFGNREFHIGSLLSTTLFPLQRAHFSSRVSP
jgi:hypothetical protein